MSIGLLACNATPINVPAADSGPNNYNDAGAADLAAVSDTNNPPRDLGTGADAAADALSSDADGATSDAGPDADGNVGDGGDAGDGAAPDGDAGTGDGTTSDGIVGETGTTDASGG
ncbi:MAG: hypothetical protein KC503_27870 [Myxococcales bacterium]|nr:hypothetical protein [Myxococcales bacterium]